MLAEEYRIVFKASLFWNIVEGGDDDDDHDSDFLTTDGTNCTKTAGKQNSYIF